MSQINDIRSFIGLKEFGVDFDLWRALFAEFFGTLFLVLVGCASCIDGWTVGNKASVPQIAFAFGIIVATMVQCIGHVSGGHINPAVTLGFLVTFRITVLRALSYIIVQCLGAIAGAAILAGVVPQGIQGNLGSTEVGFGLTGAQGFGVEMLVTFVLVLTVFAVCDEDRRDVKGSAPLAIGLSIAACHLGAVPITGSSMNPARSLGPAVISGSWDLHWVYWVGPISGGIVAALMYTYLFGAKYLRSQEAEEDTRNLRPNLRSL